jgi:hypothetical protein
VLTGLSAHELHSLKLSKLKATNLGLVSNLNNEKSKNIKLKTIRTDQLSPVIKLNDEGKLSS